MGGTANRLNLKTCVGHRMRVSPGGGTSKVPGFSHTPQGNTTRLVAVSTARIATTQGDGYDGTSVFADLMNISGQFDRRPPMERQVESRRDFHQRALGSLVTFSLLEALFRHDLW